MTVPHNPSQNRLLGALPVADMKRLSTHLELTPMPLGEVYHEPGDMLRHVYFPTTSIVSLLHVMENGVSSEIAVVGNEGILGLSLLMADSAIPCRASVRAAGFGYRLKAQLLMKEFSRGGSLQHMLLRYTQALITQTSLTVTCNRYHTIAQRLSRWLLLALDRMPSNELKIAQELIPGMFGVGSQKIVNELRKLQQSGIIDYRPGHITVLCRHGLEDQACSCYREVKREYDRLHGLDFDWRPMPESVSAWSKASSSICAIV